MSPRTMATSKTTPQKNNSDSHSGNYAIVEASGTQVWLEENRYYDLDRIHANINETISLEKVLLLNDGDGLKIGKPFVENANVKLKILSHRRGKKIIVYKMRPKKKTRRKNGHRQELTRVVVESISKNSKAPSSETTKESQPSKKTTTKVKKDSKVDRSET